MKSFLLFVVLISASSCLTREEVEAVIFLNNFNNSKGSMSEVCDRNPEIRSYGFYRVLDDGNKEFVSVCNPIARDFLAVHKDDFNRLMDRALPKPRKSKD